MATFTKSLEKAIAKAFQVATEKKHQYVTLEHLLLALVDEEDAQNVMKACSVDTDLLKENLEYYIDNELDNIINSEKNSDKGLVNNPNDEDKNQKDSESQL